MDRRSLAGCSPWGCKELDTIERATEHARTLNSQRRSRFTSPVRSVFIFVFLFSWDFLRKGIWHRAFSQCSSVTVHHQHTDSFHSLPQKISLTSQREKRNMGYRPSMKIDEVDCSLQCYFSTTIFFLIFHPLLKIFFFIVMQSFRPRDFVDKGDNQKLNQLDFIQHVTDLREN